MATRFSQNFFILLLQQRGKKRNSAKANNAFPNGEALIIYLGILCKRDKVFKKSVLT